MRIAITGSTGLIGSALTEYFEKAGHSVTPILRKSSGPRAKKSGIFWDISKGEIDVPGLEGHDVVINLAGATIARRWTKSYKEELYLSRVNSAGLLAHWITKLRRPPRVLLSASAVGFYGNNPAHKNVEESTAMGGGFLANLCHSWEMAAKPVERNGVRLLHMRFGMVLSEHGGALAKMLPIFKLGLGGRIGSGRQVISWIYLNEIPIIILYLIDSTSISGAVNFVAPEPVTNYLFTKTLGQILDRPTVVPLPAFAARMMFGEMADELLLSGAKVLPRRLQENGYQFKYPMLESALRASLLL